MYLYFTSATTPATKLEPQPPQQLKYADAYTNHLMYREKPTASGIDVKLKLQQQKSYYKASSAFQITNLKPINDISHPPPPPTAPQQVITVEKEPKIIRYTPIIINTPHPDRESAAVSPTPSPVKQIYQPQFVVRPTVESSSYYSTTTESPLAPKIVYQPNYVTPTVSTTTPAVSTFHPTLSHYMSQQPNYFIHSTKATLVKPVATAKRIKVPHATPTSRHPYATVSVEPGADAPPGINGESLSNLLKRLQDSNDLPETLTPDNIDNSIKTLVKILNNLKKNKDVYRVTAKPLATDSPNTDYDYKYYDELGKIVNFLAVYF